MVDRQKLIVLLRTLTEIVETSSDQELEALQEIRLSQIIASDSTGQKRRSKRASEITSPLDVTDVLDALSKIQTRDAGFAILEHRDLNKRELEAVARKLDLPVFREDSTQRLAEKIVEGSIGSRLNSSAIRGAER
jgi:hypothetical protein